MHENIEMNYLNQFYYLKVNMYTAAQTSSNTEMDEINDEK